MIIVLEGCDCVGKSTFAEMLSKKTGYEVLKGSSFEISGLGEDGMFEHMMSLLDMDNIIIDRFMYSNLVYGVLYDYPMMTTEQYRKLTIKMRKKSVVIYLHASKIIIAERMRDRGEDRVDKSEITSILDMYKKEMTGYFAPKVMISLDTTVSDFNVATSMVKSIIDSDETKIYIKNT